jgi:hypothetical protein
MISSLEEVLVPRLAQVKVLPTRILSLEASKLQALIKLQLRMLSPFVSR